MTDHYAVIGNPVSQSQSPPIHAAFAQATGQALVYERLLAATEPPEAFADAVQAFRRQGGRGLNVTAPFKTQAFELARQRSARAQRAGAANALRLDGADIVAENFDGVGLVRDLQDNLGLRLRGTRILLLGAGGAARGVLGPLLDEAPLQLVIANRSLPRARALLAEAGGVCDGLMATSLDALDAFGGFDVVINATSASLLDGDLRLTAGCFRTDGLAYEMSYGKGLTPFLRIAQGAGVRRLHDGVGMLIEQAAESFAWWRGVRPPTAALIRSMSRPLAL